MTSMLRDAGSGLGRMGQAAELRITLMHACWIPQTGLVRMKHAVLDLGVHSARSEISESTRGSG